MTAPTDAQLAAWEALAAALPQAPWEIIRRSGKAFLAGNPDWVVAIEPGTCVVAGDAAADFIAAAREGWPQCIAALRAARARLALYEQAQYQHVPMVSSDATLGVELAGPPPGYELAIAPEIPGVRGPRPYWRPIGAEPPAAAALFHPIIDMASEPSAERADVGRFYMGRDPAVVDVAEVRRTAQHLIDSVLCGAPADSGVGVCRRAKGHAGAHLAGGEPSAERAG